MKYQRILLMLVTFLSIALPNVAGAETYWKRVLHDGIDPFTPPQTKVSCAKWAYPWIGAKICIGHKLECKYMTSAIEISVQGPDNIGTHIEGQVRECANSALQTGAVSALVSAILTGGTGAWDVFFATTGAEFQRCVIQLNPGLDLHYENTSSWQPNWSSC